MEDVHLDKVSGDSSRFPDYPNHPKNNQKGPGFNTGILVTVVKYMVVVKGKHSPHHLESSVTVEILGVISDNVPVPISRKSPMFSSSVFLPPSNKTPNISITSILPRISSRLTPKSLMMPSPYNTDNPITTNLSFQKKSDHTPLAKNSGISSLDHVTTSHYC